MGLIGMENCFLEKVRQASCERVLSSRFERGISEGVAILLTILNTLSSYFLFAPNPDSLNQPKSKYN